jgi:hypothetical protein
MKALENTHTLRKESQKHANATHVFSSSEILYIYLYQDYKNEHIYIYKQLIGNA